MTGGGNKRAVLPRPEYPCWPHLVDCSPSSVTSVVCPCLSCPDVNRKLDQHFHGIPMPWDTLPFDLENTKKKCTTSAQPTGLAGPRIPSGSLPELERRWCWDFLLCSSFVLNCGLVHSCVVRRRIHYLYNVEEPSMSVECAYGACCCPCSYAESYRLVMALPRPLSNSEPSTHSSMK